VDLSELLARRRMTRSFSGDPVDQDLLDSLCAEALRAPTAGNCAGVRMSTVAHEHVGGVVLVTSRPQDYFMRYAKADKASSGLAQRENWHVPYWHADAAMAAMALLLLLEERGFAATLWGNFRHDADVLRWAQIDDEELFATVLIGVSDGNDYPSNSLDQPVPTRSQRVRRVGENLGQG
jgi:nitroreductase